MKILLLIKQTFCTAINSLLTYYKKNGYSYEYVKFVAELDHHDVPTFKNDLEWLYDGFFWRSTMEEKMEIREMLSESRAEFSRQYNIPVRTLENWESGKSSCPEYVRQLLEKAVREDVMSQ